MNQITEAVTAALSELFELREVPEVVISRPDSQFGDYATNVAMHLAKSLGDNPRVIAEAVADKLSTNKIFAEVSVAGPGFINMRLTDKTLINLLQQPLNMDGTYSHGSSVVIETNNPNPFKDLHIGHAYNSIIADTLANLVEAGQSEGEETHRVSYHGDVGLHVGKSMWAILKFIGDDMNRLLEIPESEHPSFLSRMYVEGAKAYDEDEAAKAEIDSLAQESFDLSDVTFRDAYEVAKAWSFEYIDSTIKRLGSQPTKKRYLERDADKVGVATVREHTPGVFKESDGAVIFEGEQFNLHTRVFTSSKGRGLYEARDLGLMQLKQQDFNPTKSIIVTAEEQRDYFNVVFKAAELCLPQLHGVTQNIPTGTVKLSTGKMSSRTGQVLNIEWLFKQLEEAIAARGGTPNQETIIGALRYAMLKVSVGSDVIFDVESSISLDGNSGPYLQYAHARARSVLSKKVDEPLPLSGHELQADERTLARKLSEYQEVALRAIIELKPHHICTYLYELAQEFNRFYEHNRIIGDEREAIRLSLIDRYADTLRAGLTILGIPAPERM